VREITQIAVVGRGLDTVGSVAFGGFAALIIVAM